MIELDDAGVEQDVRLPQPEQLALAHAGVDGRGEERAPLRVQLHEQPLELFKAQVRGVALHHLLLRDPRRRVFGDPLPLLDREREDAVDDGAEVIHRCGAQAGFLRGLLGAAA
ncbi:MAG: hypothetical protein Q8L48_05330 [Archangium sp.]|nr:hypothetical protein [Archangium sp.]